MAIDLETQQDTYTYQVLYTDGTWVPEYDLERPDGRGWPEIVQTGICGLQLVPTGVGPAHGVSIPEGATPVYFMRRAAPLNMAGGPPQNGVTYCKCIGWTRGEEGTYLFVFNDGSSLMTTDLQAV